MGGFILYLIYILYISLQISSTESRANSMSVHQKNFATNANFQNTNNKEIHYHNQEAYKKIFSNIRIVQSKAQLQSRIYRRGRRRRGKNLNSFSKKSFQSAILQKMYVKLKSQIPRVSVAHRGDSEIGPVATILSQNLNIKISLKVFVFLNIQIHV